MFSGVSVLCSIETFRKFGKGSNSVFLKCVEHYIVTFPCNLCITADIIVLKKSNVIVLLKLMCQWLTSLKNRKCRIGIILYCKDMTYFYCVQYVILTENHITISDYPINPHFRIQHIYPTFFHMQQGLLSLTEGVLLIETFFHLQDRKEEI